MSRCSGCGQKDCCGADLEQRIADLAAQLNLKTDDWISVCKEYDGLERERDQLRAENLQMRKMLVDCSDHCLCERFKTKGFDYGEEHFLLGKPKPGARWRTPRDMIAIKLKTSHTAHLARQWELMED